MAKGDYARVRVFVSYSHTDRRWLDRLQVHLRPLAQRYDIDLWDDTRLRPGAKWRDEIRSAVAKANAAVLIISADFLASEFVRTNELPPLLKSAEEEGALILSIIASPSLFLRTPELSQFQTVNNPSAPLVSASLGEQEEAFLRVAEALHEIIDANRAHGPHAAMEFQASAQEDFLEHETWTRLIKIGDWIFDEERRRIMGSGTGAYLLSRNEYGGAPFIIQSSLEFTNFRIPKQSRVGMNAGIVFGWMVERETNRYYNILLTGTELLVERVGFKGGNEGHDYEHITEPIPLPIDSGKLYAFQVRVNEDRIGIDVNGRHVRSFKRPTGVLGRVGLRPWRSQMDCTAFIASAQGILP